MCRAANFEQELGVIAACQAVGLQFNSTVSAGVGSFFLGTNLILPRSGSPPQVLRHCFPGLVPSGHRYCYSIYGRRQVIPSYTTRNLRGKIPQMARGWESKSVEQQQEEMSEQRKTFPAPISPHEQQRNR